MARGHWSFIVVPTTVVLVLVVVVVARPTTNLCICQHDKVGKSQQ